MIEIIKFRERDDEAALAAALADDVETTMPWCENGAYYGLSACCCEVNLTRDRRAEDRSANLERLRLLVEAYPREARRMVAALPVPANQRPALVRS